MLWHRSIVRVTILCGTIILAVPVALANVSLANTDLANNPTEIIRNWSQYEAYDKSYRVAFPKKPTEKKDYLDTALGKVYLVETSYYDGNNYYSTSHTTYPIEPSKYDPELGLDGSRDGISQSINMSIVSEEKTTINGFPARKVEMKGKDGALLAYLIIDPKGPTLYQVFVISGDGNVRTPENLAFLDSFSLQGK